MRELSEFITELKKTVQSSTSDHSWANERKILLEELHYLAELGRLGVDPEHTKEKHRSTAVALKRLVEKTC